MFREGCQRDTFIPEGNVKGTCLGGDVRRTRSLMLEELVQGGMLEGHVYGGEC